MNSTRFKKLEDLKLRLDKLNAELDAVICEEKDYFKNLPPNLQTKSRRKITENTVSFLEEAYDDLNCAIDCIDSAIE